MMIDMRAAVAAALETALRPGRVHFLFPPDDAKQPCISFFEENNADAAFADDEAAMFAVEYVVDVWAKTARDILPIAQGVDTAMKGLGFHRTRATDLPPDDLGMYHKNMQYSMTI